MIRRYAGFMFLLSALWANAVGAQTVAPTFELISVPVDYQGRRIQLRADLQKPTGPGPFPVVIALHSCGGYWYPPSMAATWFPLLWQQGYATLHLDSFAARGYENICRNTEELTSTERASDALAAAYVLAGRPDIQRDRIAVIGWSHGGAGAAAVTTDRPDRRPARERLASVGGKLVASVDLYGGCGLNNRVIVPLLMLVGSADDWVDGGKSCLELAKANPSLMTVQVYPGAYHDFDTHSDRHYYLGHVLGGDAAGTADAQVRVTQFLRRFMQ